MIRHPEGMERIVDPKIASMFMSMQEMEEILTRNGVWEAPGDVDEELFNDAEEPPESEEELSDDESSTTTY